MKNQSFDGFFIVEIMIALSLICYVGAVVAMFHSNTVQEHKDILARMKAVNTVVNFFESCAYMPHDSSGKKYVDCMELCWHVHSTVQPVCDTSDYAESMEAYQQLHVTGTWTTCRGGTASVTMVSAVPQAAHSVGEAV